MKRAHFEFCFQSEHSEMSRRSSQNTTHLDSSQSVHSASTTLSHLSSAGPRANSNIMPPPNPLVNQTLFHSTSNLSTRLVPLSQSSAHLSTQPSHGRWQSKSGSLSSLNEKTVPSYQVNINYIWSILIRAGI